MDTEAAKGNPLPSPTGPTSCSAVTDASLRVDLAFEEQQVKTLERKVAILERRLSAAGPPGGSDGLFVDAQTLHRELATLQVAAAQRDLEIESLRVDLEAVREADRHLGRRLTALINDPVSPEPNTADAQTMRHQESSGAMQ